MTVINFYEAGAEVKKKKLGVAEAISWLFGILMRLLKIVADKGASALVRARANNTIDVVQRTGRGLGVQEK